MIHGARGLGWVAAALVACGPGIADDTANEAAAPAVDGPVAAVVDGHPIAASAVARRVRVFSETPQSALRYLVDERLLRAHFEEVTGATLERDAAEEARHDERLLAQRLLVDIERAHRERDLTATAVDEYAATHSQRLASPPSWEVAQISVRVPPMSDLETDERGRVLASTILEDLRRTSLESVLGRLGREEEGFRVEIQRLPTVTPTSRLPRALLTAIMSQTSDGVLPEVVRVGPDWIAATVLHHTPEITSGTQESIDEGRRQVLALRRARALSERLATLRGTVGVQLHEDNIRSVLELPIGQPVE